MFEIVKNLLVSLGRRQSSSHCLHHPLRAACFWIPFWPDDCSSFKQNVKMFHQSLPEKLRRKQPDNPVSRRIGAPRRQFPRVANPVVIPPSALVRPHPGKVHLSVVRRQRSGKAWVVQPVGSKRISCKVIVCIKVPQGFEVVTLADPAARWLIQAIDIKQPVVERAARQENGIARVGSMNSNARLQDAEAPFENPKSAFNILPHALNPLTPSDGGHIGADFHRGDCHRPILVAVVADDPSSLVAAVNKGSTVPLPQLEAQVRELASFMNSPDEVVEHHQGLVVEGRRVAGCARKNHAAVVDGDVEGSGSVGHLVSFVKVAERVRNSFAEDVDAIHGTNCSVTPCSAELCAVRAEELQRCWFTNVLLVEDGLAECDEGMEKLAMNFPADRCGLLKIVEGEPSPQIAERAKQKQFNRMGASLQVPTEVQVVLLDLVNQFPELIERQAEP